MRARLIKVVVGASLVATVLGGRALWHWLDDASPRVAPSPEQRAVAAPMNRALPPLPPAVEVIRVAEPAADAGGLRVRVVDMGGAPMAGRPVALFADVARTKRLLLATTDAQGVALLPGVASQLANAPREWLGRLPVALALPFVWGTVGLLDAHEPLPREIVLQEPPLTTVQFRLVDGAGKRVADGAVGFARLELRAEQLGRRARRIEFRDGVAELAEVEIGCELALVVVAASGGGYRARTPLAVASAAVFDLPLTDELALYRWQAIGLDGAPLRERTFDLCRDTDSFARTELIDSDEQGRLALLVERPGGDSAGDPSGDQELPRMRAALLAADDPTRAEAFAELAIERAIAPGLHDEGSVHFDRGEVVVAGWVVDERGDRLARAGLAIAAAPGMRRATGWHAAAVAAQDGTFEIRDAVAPREVRIDATDPDGALVPEASDGLRVTAGSRDVVVRMARPGCLLGRIVLPRGLDREALRFVLRPERGEGVFTAAIDDEGRLRFELRRGGRFRFEVVTASAGDPVFSLEPIAVSLGATIEPRELAPLDLRDLVRALRVTVQRHGGEPLAGAALLRQQIPTARRGVTIGTPPSPSPSTRLIGRTDAAGVCVIAVVSPSIDLVVAAPGWKVAVVDGLRDDRTLELDPLAGVVLTVVGERAQGLDRTKLHAQLRMIGGASTLPREVVSLLTVVHAQADAAGVLCAPLWSAGHWEAQLFYADGGSFVLGKYPFEVATIDESVTVEITLDRELVSAALRDAARASAGASAAQR